jgi:hypothetical protein
MVPGWFPFKIVSDSPALHSRWLLLLKIEISPLSQDFRCVYKKNGEYCTVQSKKRNFIPLAPQPDESDIVVMTRYHTALKRQTTYKKRATWFNNTANENISKLAFVEYVGEPESVKFVCFLSFIVQRIVNNCVAVVFLAFRNLL